MVATVRCRLSQIELEVTGVPGLILKLGDPDSCRPRPHRDSHRKNVRRSNGIWESCSDTEHARMSQCLRRRVLLLGGILVLGDIRGYLTYTHFGTATSAFQCA